ncbi:cysteine/glutathione ABC transporter permease/ATP-binding protein CydD [Aeromonas sp. FDAARGOS 1409]|uniref:heme ABC transporter permease/ATP-binding protein CydD n=1 Tax=Aeromonas TaxID=642 RepID=UPI001C2364B9|nr:cysteine/glutathione ABC transporter permease/ATP-binding protein CydD [Aeromonas sp. FDAARGOS 1409]QXC30214.1 cysteine/glutathione ABC transporter permease/ATP-binding protein CydD [Aeromonas sp. FDAARGOS 1409]
MDKNRQKHLYGWLRRQSGHGRRWIGFSIALGLGQGVLMVMQAWLLATLLHGFIIEGATPEHSIPLFVSLLLVTLTKAALAYGREVASFKAGSAVRQAIRQLVLTRLGRLGPAYIQRRPAGSWASLLLEQIEEMQDFFSRYLPQMAIAVFIPLVILVSVFPVNWAAGLILLGTAPLIPLFMILVGVGAADANRRNFQSLARLSGHFLDRLKGLRTLQLFMRTRAEGEAIRDASEDFRERTMEVLRLAFLSTAVLEFFAAIAVALVAVYFGFSYIDHLNFGSYGVKVTLFTGLFVLFLAPEFYAPLRELGAHYHAKAQAIGAAEQLLEFLEAEVSEPASGAVPFQAEGPIRVEACSLEVLSAEGKVLVGPLDFTLEAGTRTALVGISGAGKSSLVNALLGFAPYRGSLKVNGQELAELDMSQWRQRLGWLSQNPQLFHASLRDNLLLARPAASDAELEAVLRRAQAWEFVSEKGLDYRVGDQAGGLSVGQAQRIALARTLLRHTELMVLDEPTASLDRHSERAIMGTLEQASSGQTLLMITHRLDQLSQMDNILVLERGLLVEQGSFARLCEASGPFARLLSQHRSQDNGDSLDA